MNKFVMLIGVISISALTSFAMGEEVEHPVYKSWAKHPIGTTITTKAVTNTQGQINTTSITSTLVKLTDDIATVEAVMTSDATGKTMVSPAQVYEHRRMFPLFPGVKKEDIGKPIGAKAQGTEVIKLNGKEYKAVWFEAKGSTDAGESNLKTWLCDEIPGRVIKASTKVPSAMNSTELELIEFKTP
jgi:hypothetical protein